VEVGRSSTGSIAGCLSPYGVLFNFLSFIGILLCTFTHVKVLYTLYIVFSTVYHDSVEPQSIYSVT
jgi:hypothetical protein